MEALLKVLIVWLSINYGLPATKDLPFLRYESPLEIAFLQANALTPEARLRVVKSLYANPPEARHKVVAMYDVHHETIILPAGWSAARPADQSILVHELVHHLQNEAGLRYACPEEREALAYKAQEKWLASFGMSLEREFGIDAMTLLVSTRCGF